MPMIRTQLRFCDVMVLLFLCYASTEADADCSTEGAVCTGLGVRRRSTSRMIAQIASSVTPTRMAPDAIMSVATSIAEVVIGYSFMYFSTFVL
jgi:hypothetical protein